MIGKCIKYVCLTIFGFCMPAYLAGCSSSGGMMSNMLGLESTGQQRAAKTTAKMNDTKNELIDTQILINDTISLLNGFAQQSDMDLLDQYKQFNKKLSGTEKQCRELHKKNEKMQVQGDNFFMAWEKELESFTNPDIRKRSEERRTILLSNYQEMTGSVQTAIERLEPFLAELRDIQKYLDIDLTPAGISSISSHIGRTKETSMAVQDTIDAAVADIDRVVARMP